MKNTKKISAAVLTSIIIVALFSYRFWPMNDENIEKSNEPTNVAKNEQNTNFTQISNSTEPQSNKAKPESKSQLKAGKKHYDDDWCAANDELSESDLMYARSELLRWHHTLGMASIGVDKTSNKHMEIYPNYVYVEPYESLPIDELQSLAFEGNKWAMVAFVQDDRGDVNAQEKVAKELLVHGASYYALDFLTMKSLSSASSKSHLDYPEQEVVDHIIDALAYVYWGLDSYNEGGLNSYIRHASTNSLKSILPFEKVFLEADEQVNQRLEKLTNQIAKERAAKGIIAPEPPAAINKLIANKMALKEYMYKEEMNQLRRLNVSATKKIQVTPCIEKFIEKIAKNSKQ